MLFAFAKEYTMRYNHVVAFANGVVYFCRTANVADYILTHFHNEPGLHGYVYTLEAWFNFEHRFGYKRDKYTMVMVRTRTDKPQRVRALLNVYEVQE